MNVRQARDGYLAENGWTLAQYDEPYTIATFFGLFDVRVPNGPAHRRGIMRHDLHHIATGYGTDQTGEGEISVWEVRRSMRDPAARKQLGFYTGAIVVSGALFGCLLSPRRMWRAWKRASGVGSLFTRRRLRVVTRQGCGDPARASRYSPERRLRR